MPTETENRLSEPTTRLAPSPTGALHLGNARTFLITWALARQRGWRLPLRIEDLDGPRVKPDAIESCIDTLRWLGIDWDGEPVLQSGDPRPYIEAMDRLARAGRAFRCELSRAEIDAAASAPHEGRERAENRFPPELRPSDLSARPFEDPGDNWRLVVPDDEVEYHDAFAGPQRRNVRASVGDFVIWTKRGQPSYQLAVVVDDHRQGVTEVVRGDDLLDSAARQLLLYRALGLTPEPTHTHLPLVIGPDGRRLAKRHGDTRLSAYRLAGVPPERVVGLIARWCGVTARRESISAPEFCSSLDLASIPRDEVTFTEEDDRWLCG